MTRVRAILLASLSFASGAGFVGARQQAPVTRRVPQFENSEVTVWKTIIEPNQPLVMHRHEHGRTLIALTDGVLQVVDSAGKVKDTYNLKAGSAMWLDKDPPVVTHADVNRSGRTIEVIVVQLKNDK